MRNIEMAAVGISNGTAYSRCTHGLLAKTVMEGSSQFDTVVIAG